MALVAPVAPGAALHDPRVLLRADGPGRVRDAGLSAWRAVEDDPPRARSTVARILRERRALHSGERRLVQDVVFGLLRDAPALAALLGTDDPELVWTGALVLAGLERDDPPFTDLRRRFAARGEGLAPDERLALRHRVPISAVARLRAVLGSETEAFLVASDARAPVAVRANRRRCTREELASRLAAEGITSTRCALAPDGLLLQGRPHLPSTAAYREGWLEVMDEGSQRVAALVLEATPPGSLVIDACAGAGGKTLALASGGREVLALDVRERALRELGRRAARAGVTIASRLIDPDGRLPSDLPSAATVLVDAPCSGSGVLRRIPAQRFALDDRSLSAHRTRQLAILERMAALVAPGGRLVYATCSVLREENEEVVGAFLARRAPFTLVSEVHLWPHRDGTDGYYAAFLSRADPGAHVGRTG